MDRINSKTVTIAGVLAVVIGLVIFGLFFTKSSIQGRSGMASAFHATIPLGSLDTFALLAAVSIANSGASVINGDVGVSPLSIFTGFPPGVVNGTQHINDAAAATAQSDLIIAYAAVAAQGPATDIGIQNLAGMTLTPGVYSSGTGMSLAAGGTLILDAENDPTSVFIFQTSKSITIGAGATIVFQNGASACNVFWQSATGASIGANAVFKGTIVSARSITVGAGAVIDGRLLTKDGSMGGSVILNGATVVTAPSCDPDPVPTTGGITVIKNVVGGTLEAEDFTMFVTTAPLATRGEEYTFPGDATGTTITLGDGVIYTVSETPRIGYTMSMAGQCLESIIAGVNQVCTITNTYNPPVLRLRSTVNNEGGGTALNTDWTLIADGNEESPTGLRGTSPVDSDETFLPATYTLSEVDGPSGYTSSDWSCDGGTMVGTNGIAVNYGESVTCTINHEYNPPPPRRNSGGPSPSIHVVKVANPTALPATGGSVVYDYIVTNRGTVALNDITLTDDKCSAVQFISGDSDDDNRLDTQESWSYQCSATLTQTTTNTARVTGTGSGETVFDTAQALVTVAVLPPYVPDLEIDTDTDTDTDTDLDTDPDVAGDYDSNIPMLPKTGIGPKLIPWNLIVSAGIVFAAAIALYIRRKKDIS